MKYKDPITGEYKTIHMKTSDTLPVGTVVSFEGDEIPEGYEEVIGEEARVVISPTEPTTGEEVWIKPSKNLFDITKYVYSMTEGYPLKGVLQVGKTYTISFKNPSNVPYKFLTKIDAWGTMSDDMLDQESSVPFSFVYTQAMYDKGYMLYVLNSTDSYPLTYEQMQGLYLQIEEGTTATEYEPYGDKKIYTKNENDVYEEFYDGESLDWKEATVNYDNSTVTVPVSWNKLKEISFRVLGTDSASFGYLTIPKEQWHNDGTYGVGVMCFNTSGGFQGYRRFWVSQKNTDNFIIKFDGNAGSVLVYYK